MRRYFESLRPADRSAINSIPDGLFLVRIDRVRYRWHAQKPYYSILFSGLATTNFLDTTVVPPTTYYYRITALSNWCESSGWMKRPTGWRFKLGETYPTRSWRSGSGTFGNGWCEVERG